MELGFFHQDRGYWQALAGDPEDLLPTYPEGTVQVPLKPGVDYEWQDGAWVYVEPEMPAVSTADADAERDRRVAAGFMFGGIRFQSRPDDRENIAGAATAALGAMMAGAQPGDLRWHGGDTDFVWIAEDNSTMAMDAPTVFAFGQAAMAHKQSMIFAARAIKDMDPIPADYADDQYWPSA